MDFCFCKTLFWWLCSGWEKSSIIFKIPSAIYSSLCIHMALGLEMSILSQPTKWKIHGSVLLPKQWPSFFCHVRLFVLTLLWVINVLVIWKWGCVFATLSPCTDLPDSLYFCSMDLHGYFALLTKASKVQQTQATVPQSQTNNIKAANHTISTSMAKRGNTRGMRPFQTFVDSCLFYDCSSVCNDLMLQDSLIVTPWISSGASDCSDID